MTKQVCSWILVVLATGIVSAQRKPEPIALPGGVRVPVRLITTVTSKDKVGRSIEMWTTEAVKLPNGMGEIPKGAKIFGQLTEAIGWDKSKRESRIAVAAERAQWKDREIKMRAFIVGKLRVLTAAVDREGGAFVGAQIDRGYSVAPPGQTTPELSLITDRSCKLAQASNSELGSEVVSTEHDVRMDTGTTFDLMTIDP